MQPYLQFAADMRSGDVIAFSGRGQISKIIKWKTNSPYSHVGILMCADLRRTSNKTILLIESTTLTNLPDHEHKKYVKGVQIHLLPNRLAAYNGEAWWIPLKHKIPPKDERQMISWLRQSHSECTRYDTMQAIGAGADKFDWLPGIENEPDFASLFCSELVTKALQIAGMVNHKINPSEQTPADVVAFDCFRREIKLT